MTGTQKESHLDISIGSISLVQLQGALQLCHGLLQVHGEGVKPDQGEDVQPNCDRVGCKQEAGRGQGKILLARVVECGQLQMEQGKVRG